MRKRALRGWVIFAVLLFAQPLEAKPTRLEATPQVKTDQKPEDRLEPHQEAQRLPKVPPDESVRPQSEPTDRVGHPEFNKGSDEGTEFWPPFFGYRIKVTDSLLVLFTFLLWIATRGLVKSAEKTAERQIRAYVSVKVGYSFNQGGKNKLKFEFRPILTNVGQTPAFETEVISALKVLPYPLPSDYDFSLPSSNDGRSIMTLGMQQERFTSIVFDRKLSFRELRQIKKASEKRLYVYGIVKYKDVFGRRRHTNYCYSILFAQRRSPTWFAMNCHNDSN